MSFPLRLFGIALLLLALIAATCRNQAAAAPSTGARAVPTVVAALGTAAG
jgi:hypothetical protein